MSERPNIPPLNERRESVSAEGVNKLPDHCHWRSFEHNGYKFWDTDCGAAYDGANNDARCPACGRQVVLSGFDAWWERRKSYHP